MIVRLLHSLLSEGERQGRMGRMEFCREWPEALGASFASAISLLNINESAGNAIPQKKRLRDC